MQHQTLDVPTTKDVRSRARGLQVSASAMALLVLLASSLGYDPSLRAGIPEAATCTSQAPVQTSVPPSASTLRIYAFGVQLAASVSFSTWWVASNPSDLQTFVGTNAGGGTWYADVPLTQFDVGTPRYGAFQTNVNMVSSVDGNTYVCGSSTWSRNAPSQLTTGGGTPVDFIYDANGRLFDYGTQISTPYQYQYDTLGNIQALSLVNLNGGIRFEFYPTQGGVGTAVTIHGAAFDPRGPSYNVVKFNQTVATVIAVGDADLIALVPSGATTGPISVVANGGSGTSALNFTVLPTSDAPGAQPLITGFSNPAGGTVGSAVTVNGSNFLPVPLQTTVRVGGTQVTASTSDTQILFNVPATQGSDYIYVTTPYGTAKSASVLTIASALPVSSSNTKPLTPGASQCLNPSGNMCLNFPANTCGSFTFSGNISSWMSLQFATVASGVTVNYMLYGPDNQPTPTLDNQYFNTRITSGPQVCGVANNFRGFFGSISSSNLSIHLPPLSATGGYTLYVTSSSPVPLTATLANDVVIASGGTAPVRFDTAAQSQRVMFTGTTTQTPTVDVTSISPAGSTVTATTLSNQGLQINSVTGATSGLVLAAPAITMNVLGGLLLSMQAPPGSAQVILDSTASALAVDSSPVTLSTSIAGKAVRAAFSAVAGQPITLALTGVTLTPAQTGQYATMYVMDQYGRFLPGIPSQISVPTASTGNFSVDVTPSASGVYTMVLLPEGGASSQTISATAYVSSDIVATLGNATTVSLDRPGKSAHLNYSPQINNPGLVEVYNISNASGNSLYGVLSQSGGSQLRLDKSTAQGMLFFVIPPQNNLQYVLTLTSAQTGTDTNIANGIGTAAVNGGATVNLEQPQTLTTLPISGSTQTAIGNSTAGMAKLLTFNLNSSSNLLLTVSNLSITPGNLGFTVIAPGGSCVFMDPYSGNTRGTSGCNAGCASGSSCVWALDTTLTPTGRYFVVFQSNGTSPVTDTGWPQNLFPHTLVGATWTGKATLATQ